MKARSCVQTLHPIGQHLRGHHFQAGGRALRLLAQRHHIRPAAPQLRRADQSANARKCAPGLRCVKLQGHAGPHLKCLVRYTADDAKRCAPGGKSRCLMPVQHGHALQVSQRRLLARLGQLQRAPANFLGATRVHTATPRACAINWAPRQMPRVGWWACKRRRKAASSSFRKG